MLIAQSHEGTGSGGGAGSQGRANIRVDINGDSLDFHSVMEQDYTN